MKKLEDFGLKILYSNPGKKKNENTLVSKKELNKFKKYEKKNDEENDDKLYLSYTLDYDEVPYNVGIEHFEKKFKTDDISLKNINELQKNLKKRFKTPLYKRLIDIDFDGLKYMIKNENYKDKQLKKTTTYSSNQMKELKNAYYGDYRDNKVGFNEFIMDKTGKTNLDDDKVKKKIKSNF